MQPNKHFSNGSGEPPALDLVLRNDLAELRLLHRGVEDFAAAHKLSSSVAHAVDLSLTELVTNIISYAYEDTRSHEVLVRLQCAEGLVQIRVEDDGRPFDPIKHPIPDTAAPLDDRPIGGLGIHLIRKMMADLEYQRTAGRNIFIMRARLG